MRRPSLSASFLGTLALAGITATSAAATPTAAEWAALHDRAVALVNQFPAATLTGVDHAFALEDFITDTDGSGHARLSRTYRGLQVIGGDLVVHSDRLGNFRNSSQTLERFINVPLTPGISAATARVVAQTFFAGIASGNAPELVVFARTALPELAFDVRISSVKSDGTPSERHVIINARTGAVMETWDDVQTAPATGSGNGFFSGVVGLSTNSLTATSFELRDTTRGGQYTLDMQNKADTTLLGIVIRKAANGPIFKDTDNAWGTGALADRASVAVDAQYGTAVTWDYYLNVHGRNGIKNTGVGAYNRVHYGSKYNNAYWQDSCFCMTYGDGDGTTFNPFDSLDVAGHEMSHGLTAATAKLVYSGESGGLNEANSDIFGTAVEFYANNAKQPGNYLIGERLYKAAGKSLRSMIQPSSDGVSADCYYAGAGSLDVHYSSGIANHFFYLLAEGSAPNAYAASGSKVCAVGDTRVASGNGVAVTGIGRAKAEKIWFRALTVYMTSSTNYAGARVATVNAANDLYGSGSPEALGVAAAWSAVLVN